MTTQLNLFQQGEAGCSRFYKDLDTELRHRGWKPSTMDTDYCPALVAESALLDAEIEVMHAAAKMLELEHDGVELNSRLLCQRDGLRKRTEFLGLMVKIVVNCPSDR